MYGSSELLKNTKGRFVRPTFIIPKYLTILNSAAFNSVAVFSFESELSPYQRYHPDQNHHPHLNRQDHHQTHQ